jgi:hypothetical protein
MWLFISYISGIAKLVSRSIGHGFNVELMFFSLPGTRRLLGYRHPR